MSAYKFAFGTPLTPTRPSIPEVLPADVFVLGVYPSAVHARWTGRDGDVLCAALAIAPEPHSFWDGADAPERIAGVVSRMPPSAGRLSSAGGSVNGPSGRVLIDRYLKPLALPRNRCWITDLHNTYFLSPGNAEALANYRRFKVDRCPELPDADLPSRPPAVTPIEARVRELRREFERAAPRCVVTLGSEPLAVVLGRAARPLDLADYGTPTRVEIWGREVTLLRLCHPRQAGGLGAHSPEWKSAHDAWFTRVQEAGGLAGLVGVAAR